MEKYSIIPLLDDRTLNSLFFLLFDSVLNAQWTHLTFSLKNVSYIII